MNINCEFLKHSLCHCYGCLFLHCSKIQNYSPTEPAKVWDKPLQRKALVKFNPETVLLVVRDKNTGVEREEEEDREKLVDDYLNVSLTCLTGLYVMRGVGLKC